MIEFDMNRDRNLKNLKQIGTPREDDKIYVEHMAYAKIKEKSYKEKRVFILMGHTERMGNRYITFVEGVIPVREIEFHGITPYWNNSTWSEIFREIKKCYEEMIIVGWAVDIKGMLPKVTPEIERVHREHFGGVHQLLFLLDTLEQEETFYIYKENKIVSKEGFYIYHQACSRDGVGVSKEGKELIPIKITELENVYEKKRKEHIDVEVDIRQGDIESGWKGGRYRQLVNEKDEKKIGEKEDGFVGVAIAVAMLVFVIGVGVYEDRGFIFGKSDNVPAGVVQEHEEVELQKDPVLEMEVSESETQEIATDVIPMDVISGSEENE